VVVLTDRFWRSALGGNPDTIRRSVRLNDERLDGNASIDHTQSTIAQEARPGEHHDPEGSTKGPRCDCAFARPSVGADEAVPGREGRQVDGRPAGAHSLYEARSAGAAIATRNLADFEGCGLTVVNPWEL